MDGGLIHEGVPMGVKKFDPSLDNFFSPRCPGSFAGTSQTRGGVQKSGGNKRDKLKGTNARDSQFFADFRRFLQIFAFPGNYSISGAQIFAGNRRFSQETAGNRRFLRKPLCPI